jgi:hypothetical protein
MLFRTATAAHSHLAGRFTRVGVSTRFLVAIDVPGAGLYLTSNRTYDDPAAQWWWSAGLPLFPARQ